MSGIKEQHDKRCLLCGNAYRKWQTSRVSQACSILIAATGKDCLESLCYLAVIAVNHPYQPWLCFIPGIEDLFYSTFFF